MGTYHNCYSVLSDVREDLHDHSTALVQGTDTAGAISNEQIINKINAAQRVIHSAVRSRDKGIFRSSVELTGVNSVFTLPWDFGSLRLFNDANGHKVFPVDERAVPAASGTGNKRLYYRQGNTLVLTRSGITDTYTLWYYTKPRDITMGKASAGAAKSITLATSAKLIADYYNGMIIENITSAWVDTISDYTAALVATIGTETGAANDYYGIVSDLPEPFHFLIAPMATILMKLLPTAQEPPTKIEIELYASMLNDAIKDFVGEVEDISPEEIWCDYGGGGISSGVNIPGQGYLI